MNNKGIAPIAIILIIIGVLALGGGTWYVREQKKTEEIKKQAEGLNQNQQTINEEIKDWETYQNGKLGFEIKYPKDWIYEQKYPHINQVGFYPIGTIPLYFSDTEIEILPLINFHEIGTQRVDYDLKSEMDRKKYKIGDVEIIKFIPTSRESLLDTIVYLPDGKIYEVWVDTDAREIFNKMLPTIKNYNGSLNQTSNLPIDYLSQSIIKRCSMNKDYDQYSCMRKFVKQKDITLAICNLFNNTKYKDICFRDYYIIQKDYSVCYQIKEQSTSDDCFTDYLFSLVDQGKNPLLLCPDIIGQSTKDSCYYNSAKITKDTNLCNKIYTVNLKNTCYKEAGK